MTHLIQSIATYYGEFIAAILALVATVAIAAGIIHMALASAEFHDEDMVYDEDGHPVVPGLKEYEDARRRAEKEQA